MKWIIDNWSLLVVLGIIVAYIFISGKKSIKEWLVYGVMMAEQEWGSGTGKLKLKEVYDAFVARYPVFAVILPFAVFSLWVDEALVEMRKIIESNLEIKAHIVIPDKEK